MSLGSPITTSNISLVGSIGAEYNASYTDLNSYKSWRVWKRYVGYSLATTLPNINIDINTFGGGTRAPYSTISSDSYTLNSGSILGQPSGWNSGDVLYGFSSYGYDGSGGVSIGTITSSDGTFVSPFDSSGYGYYSLRQALFNSTNNQFVIRLGNAYASPPTDAIYGGFLFYSGSSFYTLNYTMTSYTETFGSDYTTVWVFNYVTNPGYYYRLMYLPSLSLN